MRIRLRPILMTSAATMAGVMSLILGHGAGAEARANLGRVVLWGVLFSTLFMLLIVPAFYAALAKRTGSPRQIAAQLLEQSTTVE